MTTAVSTARPGAAPAVPRKSAWEQLIEEERASDVSLRAPIILGLLTLLVGFGGFFAWAALTPIASASIVHGEIVVDGQTKTVSHLDGGTIAEIVVAEGQKVKAGDVLIRFDQTRHRAQLDQLAARALGLEMKTARLRAERDGLAVFSVPPDVAADSAPADRALAVRTEEQLFVERRQVRDDQDLLSDSTIEQLTSSAASLDGRIAKSREQLALLSDEARKFEGLFADRLALQSRLREAQLAAMELESDIAALEAQALQTRQQIAQTRLAETSRRNDFRRSVVEDLRAAQTELAEVRQQMVFMADLVAKSEVRAPQDGTVANLRLFTPGSAVTSGQPILDIVPSEQPLLVSAKVPTRVIDTIHVGSQVEVRLSAFKDADLHPLQGTLTYVAATTAIDERSGAPYYAVRATIDPEGLKREEGVFLYPGMSAELYVLSGTKSALAYLAKPFTDSYRRAFRE